MSPNLISKNKKYRIFEKITSCIINGEGVSFQIQNYTHMIQFFALLIYNRKNGKIQKFFFLIRYTAIFFVFTKMNLFFVFFTVLNSSFHFTNALYTLKIIAVFYRTIIIVKTHYN